MLGILRVELGNEQWISYQLQPLELARVIATRFGFDDVDAEPTGTGGWKITAKAAGRSVSGSGKGLQEASDRLLEVLYGADRQGKRD